MVAYNWNRRRPSQTNNQKLHNLKITNLKKSVFQNSWFTTVKFAALLFLAIGPIYSSVIGPLHNFPFSASEFPSGEYNIVNTLWVKLMGEANLTMIWF